MLAVNSNRSLSLQDSADASESISLSLCVLGGQGFPLLTRFVCSLLLPCSQNSLLYIHLTRDHPFPEGPLI